MANAVSRAANQSDELDDELVGDIRGGRQGHGKARRTNWPGSPSRLPEIAGLAGRIGAHQVALPRPPPATTRTPLTNMDPARGGNFSVTGNPAAPCTPLDATRRHGAGAPEK